MTRLERILSIALTLIVVGGGGYALGGTTASAPSRFSSKASPSSFPASTATTGGMSSTTPRSTTTPPTTPMPSPAGSATGYQNEALATQIAQQIGTQLATDSPSYIPSSQTETESLIAPEGARIDKERNTVTFATAVASFAVVAVPPRGPDMTFRIAGLTDPTVAVPAGANVTVTFINADSDEAHGWELTTAVPPFSFQPGPPAFPGAFARGLGDPTPAGDGAETITFTARTSGSYQYVCPMPGHAQMGMHGAFIVN